jgi:hypothetical protein
MAENNKAVNEAEKNKEPKKLNNNVPAVVETPIKSSQKVTIMFKENRKFDLHVGREVVVFRGRESKPVPAHWLKHRDFKQVSYLFSVKGV